MFIGLSVGTDFSKTIHRCRTANQTFINPSEIVLLSPSSGSQMPKLTVSESCGSLGGLRDYTVELLISTRDRITGGLELPDDSEASPM